MNSRDHLTKPQLAFLILLQEQKPIVYLKKFPDHDEIYFIKKGVGPITIPFLTFRSLFDKDLFTTIKDTKKLAVYGLSSRGRSLKIDVAYKFKKDAK